MKHRLALLWLVPALLIGVYLAASAAKPQETVPVAVSAPEQSDSSTQAALFPDFDDTQITSVVIRSPQSAYSLRSDGKRIVSVNGQRGDKDVFHTLLEHIGDIRFTPTAPFSAQEEPLLTLTIRLGQLEYAAAFYDDGASGEYARIITTRGAQTAYGQTDGWRVGTLMLACEGIRIQDESGRETPVEQNIYNTYE